MAPILVTSFGTDSIYAEFRTDFTYLVEQYDSTGTKLDLVGTYTQDESSVSGIWTITVQQSAPNSLTSEGIFEINGTTMRYEIAQTSPEVVGVTPPTPEVGFGSTSGGAHGDINIQVYERVE